MSRIFFYGLFMDRSLLTGKGLHPEIIGPAVLPDYRLHIGERATLLRSASSRAYGIVMELADEEVRALYSEPSVREYMRLRVQVELLDTSEAVEAYCYNLPRELGLTGANPAYATELSQLVEALQFDSAYVEEIVAFGEVSWFRIRGSPVQSRRRRRLTDCWGRTRRQPGVSGLLASWHQQSLLLRCPAAGRAAQQESR